LISAIPHEAFAVVTVANEKVTGFLNGVNQFEQSIRGELSLTEPDVKFEAVPTVMPSHVMDIEAVDNLVKAVCNCPNGVIRMNGVRDGLVDTSTNLGILKSEKGEITITTFQRSFDNSAMEEVGTRVGLIFEWAGAVEIKHTFLFPPWAPDMNSPILKEMQTLYTHLFGKAPETKMVHAGLECGALKATYPHLDIISIGPSIFFTHTPDERVNIETVKDFWRFLEETLKNISEKSEPGKFKHPANSIRSHPINSRELDFKRYRHLKVEIGN